MTDLRVFTILNELNQATDATRMGTPITAFEGLEEIRYSFNTGNATYFWPHNS